MSLSLTKPRARREVPELNDYDTYGINILGSPHLNFDAKG